MASLVIVSSAKHEKLDKVVRPQLEYADVHTLVVKPDQLQDLGANQKPGTVQLLMGSSAFALLTPQFGFTATGKPKKPPKMGACRETVFNLYDRPTLVTYDVGIIDFMPELEPDIHWDVNLALRLALHGTMKPVTGDYHYVNDFVEVIQWANSLPADEIHPMTLDLETQGLDEFAATAKILTVQISYRVGHALVYRCMGNDMHVRNQLESLFGCQTINVVGANLKYDMRWLSQKWGLEISNHRFDTQLVGGLLNENRFNSLKAHIKEYSPELGGYEDQFEATHDKADMATALGKDPDGFLVYAGGDTDGCLRIYPRLKKAISKDYALARFYSRLLHPAAMAFRVLETRGICIDKPRYLELLALAQVERDKLHGDCFAMMPNLIKYKYEDNLKLTRDVIITDFLFSATGLNLKPLQYTDGSEKRVAEGKSAQPSTAWEHLKQFIDHPKAGPFVKALKQYNATCKTVDTYIVGFLAHLRSDGRFHPSYILAKGGQAGDEDEGGGTNTGRSSCKDPAYQTWPKRTAWAKRLRTVVICPPGYRIAKGDMSQGELRLMADASNCKAMIAAYEQGLDLHAVTGAQFSNMTVAQLFKLPDEQIELIRYGAKAGNFGLIYRISPAGYQAFAEASYGQKLTLQQAEANHKAFFDLYPEIKDYHDSQVTNAKRHGFVRNPLGRVRHLPLINSRDGQTRGKQERQAINAPGQGALFDMMMLLMVQITKFRPDLWMFGNTHDSLEMYVKEDTWQDDLRQVKELAENLPLTDFGWKPRVPFVMDFELSKPYPNGNLGETEKVILTNGVWVDKKGVEVK